MIVSVRYCRCCEQERWHELDVSGAGLPGMARVALAPVLALAAAWCGRWECGECGNLASDLARRPGGGEPASLNLGFPGGQRVPSTGCSQAGVGRDSALVSHASVSG